MENSTNVPTDEVGLDHLSDLEQKSNGSAEPSIKIVAGSHSLLSFRQSINKFTKGSNITISREAFLDETSFEQRAALTEVLDLVIYSFLKLGRPVLLEGFGVLLMKSVEKKRSYNMGTFSALRTENVRSCDFEKCEHFENDYLARYPQIVKTDELAKICKASLQPEFSLLWSDSQLTRLLRGFFKDMGRQVVSKGCFNAFNSIGSFIALHNRQGQTEHDWFAGADIILLGANNFTTEASDPVWFERPVLRDAWELPEAAWGKPIKTVAVALEDELSKLGYSLADLPAEQKNELKQIELAVFQNSTDEAKNPNLIFCSKKLPRSGNLNEKPAIATEFIWQVAIDQGLNNIDWETIIKLAKRIFTLGWILLESAKHKELPIGAGIASDLNECAKQGLIRRPCYLKALLTNSFKPFPHELLASSGTFRYLNLLAITESEYELAERLSAKYLLNLLEKRGLDQVSKVYRKPISLHLANEVPAHIEQAQ